MNDPQGLKRLWKPQNEKNPKKKENLNTTAAWESCECQQMGLIPIIILTSNMSKS